MDISKVFVALFLALGLTMVLGNCPPLQILRYTIRSLESGTEIGSIANTTLDQDPARRYWVPSREGTDGLYFTFDRETKLFSVAKTLPEKRLYTFNLGFWDGLKNTDTYHIVYVTVN
ncbi:uncharacterized protein LOC123542477 [Mercenaria mercenaria]|uniref:uncharacterized protein LOC123542477 n=1 Tax=Mercenaria mercenaria TaxID=6596 RepID=UPI00234F12F1|nr:uncharacterized protein LOC123542477 [Mercenaria mercenaria]